MNQLTLHATAAFGIESVLKQELTGMGFEVTRSDNGYLEYLADLKGLINSNLWLRSADRVYIKLAEFKAMTFTELFDGVKAIPWTELITVDGRIVIEPKSVKSQLFSLSDIQSISKKAVLEQLKTVHALEWFPEDGQDYHIHVHLLKDRVQILLDSSGVGLHKRGYRKAQNEAPIKETLASALIQLSNWNANLPLVDPMCGSGTLLIEAAMQALQIAPGLNRSFAFEHFHFIPQELIKQTREVAKAAILKDVQLNIKGYDRDDRALKMAMLNAKQAGVSKYIQFENRDLKDLSLETPYGSLITNPPYGERLEEVEQIEVLYTLLGKRMKAYPRWSVFVITAYDHFERCYGTKATKNRKLFNGRIQCYYYQYYGVREPRGGQRHERVSQEEKA